jgi:C4-dicarboxylate-specific signal transduction histidine kinase
LELAKVKNVFELPNLLQALTVWRKKGKSNSALDNFQKFLQLIENQAEDLSQEIDSHLAIVNALPFPVMVINHRLEVIKKNQQSFQSFPFLKINDSIVKLTGEWNEVNKHFMALLSNNEKEGKGMTKIKLPNFGKQEDDAPPQEVSYLLRYYLFTEKNQQKRLILTLKNISGQQKYHQDIVKFSHFFSLGELASGVAHEINDPLTIITTQTHLLQNQGRKNLLTPEKIAEFKNKVNEQVKRISNTTKGLLNFSNKDKQVESKLIGINDTIEKSLYYLNEKFKSKGVKVRLDLDNSLGVEVIATINQISQVFVSLLNNALEAVQHAPGSWVEISSDKDAEHLILKVTDSGHGIPVAIQDKIMRPFFSTKNQASALGLGLSSAQGIIKSIGGDIQLNKKSLHTQFLITLPMERGMPKKQAA